ncbi:hypothetical protein [Methylocapsa acidiphila]|uniref:hypothetical protein n=1 Tax=Methylocapsa acidiphila TaxID=133552 RepID=UPI000418A9AE|nr:hypothetical protein [Methylocapsa acidiphila]
MTLKKLIQEMHAYNRTVAQASECDAWQDFVADCFSRYEVGPWDDVAQDVQAVEGFVDYWLDVPKGANYDYDARTGARQEEAESSTVEEFIAAFQSACVEFAAEKR